MNPSDNEAPDRGMNAVRLALFNTLDALQSKTDPMPLDRAKAVVEVAQTLINSAKVEVDYLRASGGGESSFIESAVGNDNLPPGITGIRQHRLK